MVALGLARLVNAKADYKAPLRRADFPLVKRMGTEKRMALPGPVRIEELLFELTPAGRGHDDSAKRPIEEAQKSGGNKDR
jgi:hypothetical protein